MKCTFVRTRHLKPSSSAPFNPSRALFLPRTAILLLPTRCPCTFHLNINQLTFFLSPVKWTFFSTLSKPGLTYLIALDGIYISSLSPVTVSLLPCLPRASAFVSGDIPVVCSRRFTCLIAYLFIHPCACRPVYIH